MIFENIFSKIEKLGKKGKVDKLVKIAENRDPKVRSAVAKALGGNKGDEAFNLLILLLRDSDNLVRISTIESVGKTGDPRALEHLRRQIEREEDGTVKKAIEQAIKSIMDRN